MSDAPRPVGATRAEWEAQPFASPADALAYLRSLVPAGATLDVVGSAPAGGVATDSPLVDALVAAGARGIAPKQAWTNVADFSVRGIDAVNFGPGDPKFAHRPDEQVTVAALERCFAVLERFACA